jgi:hypothetical protein
MAYLVLSDMFLMLWLLLLNLLSRLILPVTNLSHTTRLLCPDLLLQLLPATLCLVMPPSILWLTNSLNSSRVSMSFVSP